MREQTKNSSFDPRILYAAVIVLPFLGGLSRLFLLYFSAVVMSVALILLAGKNGGINIYKSKNVALGLIIIASSIVSFAAALDRGSAFYGVLSLLAMALFVILLMQTDEVSYEAELCFMPDAACVMIALCAVMYVIPALRELVFSGGRLGGFFQYANTMALYILLSVVVLLYSTKKADAKLYVRLLLLGAGLLWTGSRFTILLSVAVLIYYGISQRRYRLTLTVLGIAALVAVLSYLILGEYATLSRVLTVAEHNSTFWGRLLYWQDSIAIFLQHPLGIGYGGYPRIQHMIQTGVYTTAFIHNEYLQMGLDHGIFAMAAFAVMMVTAVVDAIKKRDELRAVMLLIFAVHMAWDFDLQYFAMVVILLCLFDIKGESKVWIRMDEKKSGLAFGALSLVYVVIASSQAALSAGNMGLSYTLYPWDSVCEGNIMYSTPDDETRAYHMNRIIGYDPYCANAWRLMAFRSSAFGDYETMVTATERYLDLRRYDMEAYSDMVVMLDTVKSNISDTSGIKLIDDELLNIKNRLSEMEKTTSPLAYRLRDKPDFSLTPEAEKIIGKCGISDGNILQSQGTALYVEELFRRIDLDL